MSSPGSACAPAWRPVDAQHPAGSTALFGVDARTADDVWAVGAKSAGTRFDTLVEHWNGIRWRVVRSPSTSSSENLLASVSASNTNDVWAVGRTGVPFAERVQPLIEHYDGRSWKIVDAPPLHGETFLSAVLAIAPDDVWASGFNSTPKSPRRGLVLHWDGSGWSVSAVPPDPGVNNYLFTLGGTGPRDVWTTGTNFHGSGDPTTIHWDGRSWTRVPFTTGMPSDSLEGLAAVAPDDVWAGGSGGIYSNDEPVMAHWNGSAWSSVRFPRLGTGVSNDGDGPVNEIRGLAASSATDIWATGDFVGWPNPNRSTPPTGFVGHWDGTAWRAWAREPDVIPHGVSAVPDGGAWSVGERDGADGFEAVIERVCPTQVDTTGFLPGDTEGVVGETLAWAVGSDVSGAVRIRDALGLVDSGPRAAEGSFTQRFAWAGTFELLDPVGATQQVSGTVGIAPTAQQVAATTTPQILVTWATRAAPTGYGFDVQVRRPGEIGFSDWQTGTSRRSAVLTTDAGPGSYDFRARLRRADGTGETRYSPVVSVSVGR